MAFSLKLPTPLGDEGWKVKIRENERVEDPHVTIFHKGKEWRLGLRNKKFLDPPGGSWREIDKRVREVIDHNWGQLQTVWNRKYPENPIESED
jgi:hypothetical protein